MTDNRHGGLHAISDSVPVAEALELLRKAAGHALHGRQIAAHFELERSQRQTLLRTLDALVDEGVLVRKPDQRYSLSRKVRLITGRLALQRGGYGFVAAGEGQEDIFVPPHALRDAFDGDRVLVVVEQRQGRFGARTAGRVLQVVERGRREILGRFMPGPQFGLIVPLVPRFGPPLLIPPAGTQGVLPDQIAVVRIDSWSKRERALLGTIVSVLGDTGDPAVDVASIAWKYGLATDFPAPVLAAAARIPETVTPDETEGRIDLRALPLVTIDGETARDFDDAVAVRRERDGAVRLWVAIADVGHYLDENGIIDREACLRGTSVYFPDRCLPMLPERLSNGICSLNPGVDRLAFVVEMLFSATGRRQEQRFYPAVMRSRARLTYTQVYGWLATDEVGSEDVAPELITQARVMEELALRLSGERRERGSIDFDLPEAEIVLDMRGLPENIVRRERNIAHRIIEEFMLAANEAVADYLAQRNLPFLYRVHELPDMEKLADLQEFVAHFGYGLALDKADALAHSLQGLLAESVGKPEARAIHQQMLRSMQQAYYSPHNVGHFGLAAERYCHFTSPIRRYPDLVVHRVLRRALQQTGEVPTDHVWSKWRTSFSALGESLSALERRAMEAEREMLSLCKCRFMADKIGEEYDGIVSGVQPFGLFVELKDWFVEGLIAVAALGDDYYEFDPGQQTMIGQQRRRTFRIGDPLRVRVVKVDTDWREIDFALAENSRGFHRDRRKTNLMRRKRSTTQ